MKLKIGTLLQRLVAKPDTPTAGQIWMSRNNGKFIKVVGVERAMSGGAFIDYCPCGATGELLNPLPMTLHGGSWREFAKANGLVLTPEFGKGAP